MDFVNAIENITPPSADALAEERRQLAQQKACLKQQVRLLVVGAVLFCVVAIMMIGVSLGADAAVKTVIGAVIGAAVLFLALAGAGVFAWVVVGAVAGALPGVFGWDTVLFVAGVLTVAVAGIAILTMNEKIDLLDKSMDTLADLIPSDHPDECIELDEWRDKDETLDRYLKAVASENRKPVLGEYLAAKEWMNKAEGRAKRARAEHACERFAEAK